TLLDLGAGPVVGRDAVHVAVGDVVADATEVRDDVPHAPARRRGRRLLERGVGLSVEQLRELDPERAVRALVVGAARARAARHAGSDPADAIPTGQLTP